MAELANLGDVPSGLWPAWSDTRVDAVASMAGDAAMFGQAGLAKVTVPVMAIGGTADRDSPFVWSTQRTYEYASSLRKVEVTLNDAEHLIFAGECDRLPSAEPSSPTTQTARRCLRAVVAVPTVTA